MKKNGFMVYELVISFALAFAILLVIFNTSISLNKKLSELYVKNKVSSKQVIINKKVGSDFTNKVINKIVKSGNDCSITFDDGKTLNIKVSNNKDDKYISIDNQKILFSNEVKIDTSNIKCNKSEYSLGYYFSHLKIPITYGSDTIDYGIDLYNFLSN